MTSCSCAQERQRRPLVALRSTLPSASAACSMPQLRTIFRNNLETSDRPFMFGECGTVLISSCHGSGQPTYATGSERRSKLLRQFPPSLAQSPPSLTPCPPSLTPTCCRPTSPLLPIT